MTPLQKELKAFEEFAKINDLYLMGVPMGKLNAFLRQSLPRFTRSVIEEAMPDEYQNVPIPERPKLYENIGWLGWNAYRTQFKENIEKIFKTNHPTGE